MIQIVCCDACHQPVHITTGSPAVQAWEDGRGRYYHSACYKPSELTKASGFRPLHIEDGQVQEALQKIRRLLQIPEPDLAVLYHEDALKNRRYVPGDDSEIEMLRYLIHVELDTLAAQPGKGV